MFSRLISKECVLDYISRLGKISVYTTLLADRCYAGMGKATTCLGIAGWRGRLKIWVFRDCVAASRET